VTRKDHFPLPFIDQMLERLAGKSHYYFLDGFPGYLQIHIALEDQEKTTFTCPFGTFAYRRMPFGLCNAPGTFQWCMLSIFSDFFRELHRGVISQFPYPSCRGIEVNPAKIVFISQLPYPSCVREVRSFLGHAGFYRRFIKDFSKVALPLSNLLQKEVEFDFDDRCKEAFDCLKRAVTTTPIIQAPNWTAPFKLMCDASNYALGAVLAQKIDKLPRVIYYASRTLDVAQANYTTIEKELLAIVFIGPQVVILAYRGQLARCLTAVSIGPPSSKMHGESVALVSLVREQAAHFHGDNRCLNNPCCSERCLMSGV